MKINDLAIAVAVADEMSFIKASRKLFISQPAVTQNIKKTEEELGFPLFIRNKHRISLTAQGSHFLASARRILDIYQKTVSECSAMQKEQDTLNVGYIGQAHLHNFQKVIADFTSACPSCRLVLTRITPENAVSALTSGPYDLLITPLDVIEGSNIPYQEIYTDYHYCVMNSAHPLARRKKISLQDLCPYRLLMPDRKCAFQHFSLLRKEMDDSGLCFRYGIGVNVDIVTVKLLQSYSDIALMPGFSVPVHPGIASVPLNDHTRISMGLAGKITPGSAAAIFRDTALEIFKTS